MYKTERTSEFERGKGDQNRYPMVRRYCWGVHGTRGEALGRYSLPQFFFLRSHSGLPGMTNITMSGVPCSWTPVCFPGLAVSDRSLLMTAEAHGHPTQLIL